MIVLGPTAPDDVGIVALEGHHVHHPPEQARHEAPSHRAARLRGRDRRLGAEQGLPVAGLAPPLPLAPGREAPVHMLMPPPRGDRKSTRLNSSHITISYAVFCLKKKKKNVIHKLTKTTNKKTNKI